MTGKLLYITGQVELVVRTVTMRIEAKYIERRARTTKSEYGNLFSSMYQINDLGHGFFGTKYTSRMIH